MSLRMSAKLFTSAIFSTARNVSMHGHVGCEGVHVMCSLPFDKGIISFVAS